MEQGLDMRLALAFLAACCSVARPAASQQFPHVAGIDSIRVLVGSVGETARAAGLDRVTILARVELELRRSGIPVSRGEACLCAARC